MKKIFYLILTTIIILIYLGFDIYSTSLFERLYCNRVFTQMDESFKSDNLDEYTYKFYIWENERLDCIHGKNYLRIQLFFINDSTVIKYIKYTDYQNSNLFALKYLLDINKFSSKDYKIYTIKNDTLISENEIAIFDNTRYMYTEYPPEITIPESVNLNRREYYTFKIIIVVKIK